MTKREIIIATGSELRKAKFLGIEVRKVQGQPAQRVALFQIENTLIGFIEDQLILESDLYVVRKLSTQHKTETATP